MRWDFRYPTPPFLFPLSLSLLFLPISLFSLFCNLWERDLRGLETDWNSPCRAISLFFFYYYFLSFFPCFYTRPTFLAVLESTRVCRHLFWVAVVLWSGGAHRFRSPPLGTSITWSGSDLGWISTGRRSLLFCKGYGSGYVLIEMHGSCVLDSNPGSIN